MTSKIEEREIERVTYKNYALLIQAIFLNFTFIVENPFKDGQVKSAKDPKLQKRRLKRWYEKALKWCNTDNLLFDGYEIYFLYSGDRIRGILKKRIAKKLEQL